MAKRDDNPHRLNLVIPQKLLEELRTIAKERFGAKDNHLTGQPEISQTLLQLIRIGIDAVINPHNQQEKPESTENNQNDLAIELTQLKERVDQLEGVLHTHIQTGDHIQESSEPRMLIQTPTCVEIQTNNPDEQLPHLPICTGRQIDNLEEKLQQASDETPIDSPDRRESQSDDTKQIGVQTSTHIEIQTGEQIKTESQNEPLDNFLTKPDEPLKAKEGSAKDPDETPVQEEEKKLLEPLSDNDPKLALLEEDVNNDGTEISEDNSKLERIVRECASLSRPKKIQLLLENGFEVKTKTEMGEVLGVSEGGIRLWIKKNQLDKFKGWQWRGEPLELFIKPTNSEIAA